MYVYDLFYLFIVGCIVDFANVNLILHKVFFSFFYSVIHARFKKKKGFVAFGVVNTRNK